MYKRLENLVATQAEFRPDAPAIIDDAGPLSYGQLELGSNRLARALSQRGFEPGDRACILLPKSASAIVSIFGVLKAGGVYVPLDVKSPPARSEHVIEICRPCWVILSSESRDVVTGWARDMGDDSLPELCWLDTVPAGFERWSVLSGEDWNRTDPRRPEMPVEASPVAYIIFTSGSTGRPKGVPATHESVIHFISWANDYFGLDSSDRLSCHSPLHFDGSVWDIFGGLAAGAEVHLVPQRTNLLPSLVVDFIRESRLTQWASVPSVLSPVSQRDLLAPSNLPNLRRLIWYGEVFHTASLRYWMHRLPHVEFTNLYGPTEATIVSTYHTLTSIPDIDEPVPIGKPIPGKPLIVLDGDMKPIPTDVIGDLYIGGAHLSPGYWRNPEQTAAAFFKIPTDSSRRWYRTGDLARVDAEGVFHFHGRTDRQIKSRGNRIELDEIAAALSRLPGLAASAVVAIPVKGLEGMRICAAYVSMPGVTHRPAELRKQLSATLPTYMLPRRWLALDELPRNQGGKVDHRRLERRFLEEERT